MKEKEASYLKERHKNVFLKGVIIGMTIIAAIWGLGLVVRNACYALLIGQTSLSSLIPHLIGLGLQVSLYIISLLILVAVLCLFLLLAYFESSEQQSKGSGGND